MLQALLAIFYFYSAWKKLHSTLWYFKRSKYSISTLHLWVQMYLEKILKIVFSVIMSILERLAATLLAHKYEHSRYWSIFMLGQIFSVIIVILLLENKISIFQCLVVAAHIYLQKTCKLYNLAYFDRLIFQIQILARRF